MLLKCSFEHWPLTLEENAIKYDISNATKENTLRSYVKCNQEDIWLISCFKNIKSRSIEKGIHSMTLFLLDFVKRICAEVCSCILA